MLALKMDFLRDTSSIMFKNCFLSLQKRSFHTHPQLLLRKFLKIPKCLKNYTTNNHIPTTLVLRYFCRIIFYYICFISSSISLIFWCILLKVHWLQRVDIMSSLALEELGHAHWRKQISSCDQLNFSLFQDVFHMVVEVPRWSNAKMEVCFTLHW